MDNKDTSCYSSSLLISYARKKGISEEQLFKGIEDYSIILGNPLEWTDVRIWTKLAENIESAFNYKKNIIEHIANEITKNQVSSFLLLFIRIAPVSLLINSITKHFENNSSKIVKIDVKLIRNGEIDIIFVPLDILKYSVQLCAFNRGATTASLKFKGLKNLSLTEISCAAQDPNAKACHYKLTWTPQFKIIERIKEYLFLHFRDHKAIVQSLAEGQITQVNQYKEIQTLKDFYSHIMENMSEGIIWLNSDLKITFANSGFHKMAGYIQEDLEGNFFTDFLSRDSVDNDYNEFFTSRRLKPGEPETRELKIIKKTGEIITGRTTILWVETEHHLPGFLVSIVDITEQKLVERKLFATENRYRSLYENSPAIIIGLDIEGNFIYANPAMTQQSGYTEDELKEMHFGELVAPGADFDVNRLIKGKIEVMPSLQDVRYKTKNKEWKTIAFNSYPLFDESGNYTGISGIGVDITETKLLNEQLIQTQRLDMLGKMAGGLAHDFNNLLNVILGYSEFISIKSSEEFIKAFALNIKKATDRSIILIKNLLSFSRCEPAAEEVFCLNEIVDEVYHFAIPLMPFNVQLSVDIPEKTFMIHGDPGKINQCILNICINARDASTGRNDGKVTLKLNESTKEGFARIDIIDNGTGIPPDIIGRIFDPFFSTKDSKKGTGLGLSVVYGIIKDHKGVIEVDSQPGEGTIFHIEIPVATEEQITEDKKRKEEQKKNISDIGTFIVVDEDEMTRKLCREALNMKKYRSAVFPNAEEALPWFLRNSGKVVIIISDIMLSSMNGIEMVEKMREVNPELLVLWFVENVPTDMKKPPQTDTIIKKPFSPDIFLDAIDDIVKKLPKTPPPETNPQ